MTQPEAVDWTLGGILAFLGLKFVNVIVGACSSFIALRFWDNLGAGEKWITFFGGWILAAYGAPPLIELLEVKQKTEILFVILLGVFGMALAAETIKVIRDPSWVEFVKAIILRRPPPPPPPPSSPPSSPMAPPSHG